MPEVLMVTGLLLLFSAAHADIGPPPTCEAGTHREYLYGNHCVKDGYHLVSGAHGGAEEVADTPVAPTDPAAPTDPVAPSPPTPVAPAPTPTKTEKGCSTTSGSATMLLVGLAAALTAGRRTHLR